MSGFFCDQCGNLVDKKSLYFNDDKKGFGLCSEKCHSAWKNLMAEKKELCLKDIPAKNWDKVRILAPWEEIKMGRN